MVVSATVIYIYIYIYISITGSGIALALAIVRVVLTGLTGLTGLRIDTKYLSTLLLLYSASHRISAQRIGDLGICP